MKKTWIKEWGIDVLIDIVGGILMALGLYNFAVAAEFPLTGLSGIAVIFYQLFKFPIGVTTIILNIPVAMVCFRLLGTKFFAKSIKTMIITSMIVDILAPMFPIYEGDRLLAAICAGVLPGLGIAMIYMRNSSTGGTDFIIMAIKVLRPHLSIGKISFGLEVVIILIGALTVFRDPDGLIYAMIVNYLLSMVIDKVMYGTNAGKERV